MIIGQYKILEKIGEGGMGIVYKAEHTTLEQIVALKALPIALSSNTEMRERFIREAKIQAKLSHQNVVNLHNFFEHDGNFYLVMEYIEGETIESILRKSGLIPPEKCISIFKQVLDGIGYAHSKGVIHRDIKPSNIIINREGVVKITDFGIAKIAGDFHKTQTGIKIGTLWYMSPEQVRGQTVGITTDIYSLGITLFEMVTGRLPFTGDSEYQIMKTIIENKPPSPREFYPYVPLNIEQAILKSIEKNPYNRFQTTREFLNVLIGHEVFQEKHLSYHEEETYPIRKPEIPNIFHKITVKKKNLLWTVVIALLLISFSLIYFGMSSVKKDTIINSQQSPSVLSQPNSKGFPISSLHSIKNDNPSSSDRSQKIDKKKSKIEAKDSLYSSPIKTNEEPKNIAGSWGRKKLKE